MQVVQQLKAVPFLQPLHKFLIAMAPFPIPHDGDILYMQIPALSHIQHITRGTCA
jgi:hypothetical protein